MAKVFKTKGWIYFISSQGLVKVGMTRLENLQERLRNYLTHNPQGITVIASAYIENVEPFEKELLTKTGNGNGSDWVLLKEKEINEIKKMITTYANENPASPDPKPKSSTKRIPGKDSVSSDKVPFTQVANQVLNDRTITARAKGIYAYLYSKPDGWDFSYLRIAKDHMESKNTILKTLQELEKAGYLSRKKTSSGRTDYHLTYSPNSKDWSQANPKDATDQSWERPKVGTVSNTNNTSNKEEPNKEESSVDGLIPDVIKAFEPINPACKSYYGRKPQRDASRELIKHYGFTRVVSVIERTLPATNQITFFPTITTPLQLFENWAKLESKIKQYKNKTATTGRGLA